ncbi:ribosomal protein S10 [Cryptococcus sp. DSM 104549]
MSLSAARSGAAVRAFARPAILPNAVASSSRYLSTTAPTRNSAPPAQSSSNEVAPKSNFPVPFPRGQEVLTFPPFIDVPAPHGVHVATLHIRSYHTYYLDLSANFAVHSARSMGIPTSLPAALPMEKSLYTVLKSPFVHKKAQENFERRTHKRVISLFDADRPTLDMLLRYIRRNSLPGVGMKVYLHEWVEFGFGRTEKDTASVGLGPSEQQIQEVSEELVKMLSEEGVKEAAGETAAPSEAVAAGKDVEGAQVAEKAEGEKVAEKAEE